LRPSTERIKTLCICTRTTHPAYIAYLTWFASTPFLETYGVEFVVSKEGFPLVTYTIWRSSNISFFHLQWLHYWRSSLITYTIWRSSKELEVNMLRAPAARGGGCCRYQVILIWLATLTASPQSCRAKTTPLAFSSSSVALLPPLRAVRSTVLSPTQPMQWHRSLSKPGPYCQPVHCERRSLLASAKRTSAAMTASSADGSGPIRQFLEGLRRADLQSLAKENNIAANKV